MPDGIAFCEAEPSIFPELSDTTKLEAEQVVEKIIKGFGKV